MNEFITHLKRDVVLSWVLFAIWGMLIASLTFRCLVISHTLGSFERSGAWTTCEWVLTVLGIIAFMRMKDR